MGSLDAACITGFLCRLCSEIHRKVIHIYGHHGRKYQLAHKINQYLPVNIHPEDALPKTVCNSCMCKVLRHHDMLLKMLSANGNLKKVKTELQDVLNTDNTTDYSSDSSDDIIETIVSTHKNLDNTAGEGTSKSNSGGIVSKNNKEDVNTAASGNTVSDGNIKENLTSDSSGDEYSASTSTIKGESKK